MLDYLNKQLVRPPDPSTVNPDAYAWHHLGQRKLLAGIEEMIQRGEALAAAARSS